MVVSSSSLSQLNVIESDSCIQILTPDDDGLVINLEVVPWLLSELLILGRRT